MVGAREVISLVLWFSESRCNAHLTTMVFLMKLAMFLVKNKDYTAWVRELKF